MKRLFSLLSFLLLALTAHLQNVPPADANRAVAQFVECLSSSLPIYVPDYYLTLTQATHNDKNKTVRLSLGLDADRNIETEKEYYQPFIASLNPHCDFSVLAANGYSLCMQINSDRTIHNPLGSAGIMVTLTPYDIRDALRGNPSQTARSYLASYAQRTSALLPMPMGQGETFVQCYLADTSFAMAMEYADTSWPAVRQFLHSNADRLRVRRAQQLVADTTNALALSAYIARVHIHYIYRNTSHTDSLTLALTPWLIEQTLHQASLRPPSDTLSPTAFLLNHARQLSLQAPLKVDDNTQLLQCQFDTAARLLSYLYDIPDRLMLQYENNPALQQSLRSSILLYFQSSDKNVAALVRSLVSADAAVRYTYRSAHGSRPLDFQFSPLEIRQAAGL